jgi:hydroxyisourate hydrolase
MSGITTHVLDTAKGCPAAGINVSLELKNGETWTQVATGTTNKDGRVPDLTAEHKLQAGVYKLTFNVGEYLSASSTASSSPSSAAGFYPYVPVVFEITNADQHYHVPLLLSPFGYSTYRGS